MRGYQEARLLHYQVPLFRLPEFVIGCALGLVHGRVPKLTGAAGRGARDLLLVASLAWIAGVMFLDAALDSSRGSLANALLTNLRMNVLFVPGFAGLLFAVSLGPTFAHRFLEHRWMQALGLASYTLCHPLPDPAAPGAPPDRARERSAALAAGSGVRRHDRARSGAAGVIEVPARDAILRRRAETPS